MALVKQTNADVYLHEHASIFAYEPASRMLIWGCYDHEKKHWELHKNGKLMTTGHTPIVKRDDVSMLTHYQMLYWLCYYQDGEMRVDGDIDNYIKGRISPDKSTIYIHDMKSRWHHPMIERMWSTHIKNALHKVAMYMKEQTTEERTYDKNPFGFLAQSGAVQPCVS